ncbi:AAA family ATPase [Kitasatospora gansuensis]
MKQNSPQWIQHWPAPPRGQARIVLVEGAVGCGKSELADAVADRAEAAGATVLRALGSAAERDLPLGILRQLTACTPPGVLPELTGEPGNANVGAMQAFSAAAGELAALAPVVIVVDDVHHADDQSCAYLLHLARSTRWARILLVLTESVHERGDDPVFGTELLRRPNFLRIRLERLNAAAVARLVAEQLGPDAAERLAYRFAEATGGNPLLLRAMVEEHRVTGAQEPEVGGAYAQAVLTCLYRCGPAVRELAEVLAVLDDLATAERAARLLDLPLATVNRGVQALSAAGILDGARFRYPAARAAVLEWTDDSARAELHRRAAELAHRSGAAASSVAAQLLAADRTDLPWAVPVLHEAAEQLLADGAAERASACLELADRSGADDEQRAQFRTMLAAIAARSDPGAAERHLTGPLELLRAGSLAPARLAALARLLATQGRIDEAAEVLERITAQDPAAPDGAVRDGAGRDSVNRPGQGAVGPTRWTACPPSRAGPPRRRWSPARRRGRSGPVRRPRCGPSPSTPSTDRQGRPPSSSCAARRSPRPPWRRSARRSGRCCSPRARPGRCPGATCTPRRRSGPRPRLAGGVHRTGSRSAAPAGRSDRGGEPGRGRDGPAARARRQRLRGRCLGHPDSGLHRGTTRRPANWPGRCRKDWRAASRGWPTCARVVSTTWPPTGSTPRSATSCRSAAPCGGGGWTGRCCCRGGSGRRRR